MASRRIVLIGVPTLLRDILYTVAAGDAQLLQVDGTEPDLLHAVGELNPDVVLIGADEFEVPRLWEDMLAAYPGVRVVAVTSRGHRALVFEMTGHLTPESLAEAIRLETKPA